MKSHTLFYLLLSLMLTACFHSSESKDKDTPLSVVKIFPEPESQNVYIGEEIFVEFNKPIESYDIRAWFNDIPVSYIRTNSEDSILKLKPKIPLTENTRYKVLIENIFTLNGVEPHQDVEWEFSTGKAENLGNVSNKSSNEYEVCVIDGNSDILCWGAGYPAPRKVKTLLPLKWKSIAMGSSYKCAIDVEDALWCWGSSYSGELGFAGSASEEYPRKVELDVKWKSVSLSQNMASCGITMEGSLYCWGCFP